MILELSPDWRIRRYDRLNFVIEEQVTVKPQDEAERLDWKNRGFYGSLESALSALPGDLARSEAVTTYDEFLSRWDALIRGRNVA